MTTVYIADTGVFVRCGGPNKEKFQRLRRTLRQADVSLRIPQRVYEELGAIPQRTSILRGTFRILMDSTRAGSSSPTSPSTRDEDRRREIAREWEHLQRRIKIVGFAIREWDFLAPTTEPTDASC